MERKTYLGRYQVSLDERGEPVGLERAASSVTFKAEDTTSGEPVTVQVVRPGPLEQVPRDKVEADARAAQQLDHVNIAKLRDFGFEDTDIVYVREYLEGSTLDAWVLEHGPLPVAAVMRIGLQGVSALSAAKFQSVTHRAMQPASLMIVPGQTPEGDWPLVKILNFGALAPTFSRHGFTTTGPGDMAQFASPEQLQGATADFKSDIYSLGATLWFLLTGAPPRAGMVQRSRGIPKNVAAVISRMLAANPEQRPIDPLVLQEDIRACLGRAERRDSIGRRFGLPAKVAKPDPTSVVAIPPVLATTAVAVEPKEEEEALAAATEATPANVGRFLLRPLAWAAVLLTVGAIAVLAVPKAVRSVQNWQAQKEPEAIGVKVGVPDSTANAVAAVPTAASPAAADTQTAAAPAAPEVSPPQETAVAANRAAPAVAASPSFPNAGSSTADAQPQPATTTAAAAPATTAPETSPTTAVAANDNTSTATETSAPSIAYQNNGGVVPPESAATTQSSRTAAANETAPSTASTNTTTSRAPTVASNTARPAVAQAAEPAAPAEGPDDSAAQAQSNTRESRATARRDTQTATKTRLAPKTASASAEAEPKPPTTAPAPASRNRTAARSQQRAANTEVRPAIPVSPEEEAGLPPVPRGSQRARFLGTRADGAMVFGMPSSERVFVAPPPPPGSPRRIIRRALPEAEQAPARAEPVTPEDLEEIPPPNEDEE